MQLAQAQARRIQAEGDLDSTREVFRGVVGAEPEGLATAAAPTGLPASRDEVIAASADNPALAAAADTVDAAKHGVDGALAELRPASRRRPASARLIIQARSCSTIPLFDGGLAESRSRGAKQELQQRRLELDGQRQSVRQDALTAWQALNAARSSTAAFQAQAAAARATAEGLKREQRQGLRTQSMCCSRSEQLPGRRARPRERQT